MNQVIPAHALPFLNLKIFYSFISPAFALAEQDGQALCGLTVLHDHKLFFRYVMSYRVLHLPCLYQRTRVTT